MVFSNQSTKKALAIIISCNVLEWMGISRSLGTNPSDDYYAVRGRVVFGASNEQNHYLLLNERLNLYSNLIFVISKYSKNYYQILNKFMSCNDL